MSLLHGMDLLLELVQPVVVRDLVVEETLVVFTQAFDYVGDGISYAYRDVIPGAWILAFERMCLQNQFLIADMFQWIRWLHGDAGVSPWLSSAFVIAFSLSDVCKHHPHLLLLNGILSDFVFLLVIWFLAIWCLFDSSIRRTSSDKFLAPGPIPSCKRWYCISTHRVCMLYVSEWALWRWILEWSSRTVRWCSLSIRIVQAFFNRWNRIQFLMKWDNLHGLQMLVRLWLLNLLWSRAIGQICSLFLYCESAGWIFDL